MLEDQKTGAGTDFYIDLTTMAFYQLLGVGVILIFMLRQANKMAGEFSGAGGGDFSGAVAGVASAVGGAGYLGGAATSRLAGQSGGKNQRGASATAAKVAGATPAAAVADPKETG
jgi:hypothetical protein